jgi:hypothetical protein
MPSSSGSLVTAFTLKSYENFQHVLNLYLTKITLTKVAYFSRIYYHILHLDPILNGAGMSLTLQEHISVISFEL